MKKFTRFFAITLATLSLIVPAQAAFAEVSYPGVDWGGSGKGSKRGAITAKLDVKQYRWWLHVVGQDGAVIQGKNEARKIVEALTEQNKKARAAVPGGGSGGGGAGGASSKTGLVSDVDSYTCYGPVKSKTKPAKKDKKGKPIGKAKTTYFASKYKIKADEEQGWISGAGSGCGKANLGALRYSSKSGKSANSTGKAIGSAYKKKIWSKEDKGTEYKDSRSKFVSDKRCGTAKEDGPDVEAMNEKEEKESLDKSPEGWKNPFDDGNDYLTTGSPVQNGCIYEAGGISGRMDSLLDGGMKCVVGYNFGKKIVSTSWNGSGAPSVRLGEDQFKTHAGTPWVKGTKKEEDKFNPATGDKKLKPFMPFKVTDYGNNPSWGNCAEDKKTLNIDSSLMGSTGSELLPSTKLGRYSNTINVVYDTPDITVSESGITINAHHTSVHSATIQIQQGCQGDYLQDRYTKNDAKNRDIEAETMSHYSFNENIPDRYLDVYLNNPPGSTVGKPGEKERVKLSYTMSDCMYKPGLIKKSQAYLCGTSKQFEDLRENSNIAGEGGNHKALVKNLDEKWNTPDELYESPTGTEKQIVKVGQKAGKGESNQDQVIHAPNNTKAVKGVEPSKLETPGNGQGSGLPRLDIVRSNKPTYLRWSEPTILIDSSKVDAKGKSGEHVKPSNLRIARTLAMTSRYKNDDAGTGRSSELLNGTPWVDTPVAKKLLSGDTQKYNINKTESVSSLFNPKNMVSPGETHTTPVGETGTVYESKVRHVRDREWKNNKFDLRFYDSRKGNPLDYSPTLAGTQDENSYKVAKSKVSAYRNGKTAGDKAGGYPITLVDPKPEFSSYWRSSGRFENNSAKKHLREFFPPHYNAAALDKRFNATLTPENQQLAAGIGSVWESKENRPHRLRAGAFIGGEFPVVMLSLKGVSTDNNTNKTKADFGQVDRAVNSELLCISAPVEVYSLRPSS